MLTGKRRFVLVALSGALVACLGWAFFPWPDKCYRYSKGTQHFLIEEQRRFSLLAIHEWGFSSSTMIYSGPDSGNENKCRFGFFEITDSEWIHWENWQEWRPEIIEEP
jgi:hypothetical protein